MGDESHNWRRQMATAQLTTARGTIVTLDGAADEVATLIAHFERGEPTRRALPPTSSENASPTRSAPLALVSDLIDAGFFAQPRALGAIKNALAEQGRFYPATSLSPALLRLVRRKALRRVKDKKRW